MKHIEEKWADWRQMAIDSVNTDDAIPEEFCEFAKDSFFAGATAIFVILCDSVKGSDPSNFEPTGNQMQVMADLELEIKAYMDIPEAMN